MTKVLMDNQRRALRDRAGAVALGILIAVYAIEVRSAEGGSGSGKGDTNGPSRLPEVVVTATRSETQAANVTRSVTVLNREEIDEQSVISRDIGDLLGKTVPGFGTSTEGLSNETQHLRGRNYLVMIDGVPVSIPFIKNARDLKVIDPESLERVEVIRGGTALYGFGATGGLVNYITRDPVDEDLSGYSEAGTGFSTEHADGSLRWHTAHGVSGARGPFDFLFNGSFAQRNRFFDSDGDRIAPNPLGGQGGLTDTDEFNLLGKLGFDFGNDRQRLELMVNSYNIDQDTGFVTLPGNFTAGRKAVGVAGEPLGNQTRTENHMVSLVYEHRDVWGSRVKNQAYYNNFQSHFPIVQFNTGFSPPTAPSTDNAGSINQSDKFGNRFTVDTPVLEDSLNANLIWGVDYLREEANEEVVGANAVFGTPSVPDIEQDSVAPFLQGEVPVSDLGEIQAGVRHEEIWLDVPTFTGPGGAFGPGGTVSGGDLSYDETLFNATAVYYVSDQIDLFGGYSQGFSVADVRGVLRGPAFSGGAGGSAEALDPEAQKVDNYELGLRGDWGWLNGSLVGFFSESDLGTTFQSFARLNRQEEEIWGVESSLEAEVHKQWTVGGTLTWMDSRTDLNNDGDLDEELPTRRVPPIKLTGYVEYETFDWWKNRLQVLYSGSREPDGATNFGGTADELDSYVTLDYYASFAVGPGNLRLGIENLLNEDYFPVASQAFGTDSGFSKGQGRAVTLSYRMDW